MGVIKVGKHKIKTSNEDKILFPEAKITKGDIIDYYEKIGPIMLPYVKKRLLTMIRFPDGIKGEGFYQKDTPDYFPKWIERYPLKTSEGKTVKYTVIESAATLVYIANQGCITPHVWLSKITDLYYPDRLIFDLDPSGKNFDFSKVRKTALVLKELMQQVGLHPFVMTTGSRGLHVTIPLSKKQHFNQVREFAHSVSEYLVSKVSNYLTLEMQKDKRGTKIFMDYLRNAPGATAVAPYAIRPRPGAPVATPIDWDEVKDSKLTSRRYDINTVFERLNKEGDPWKEINKQARSLTRPINRLKKIIDENSFKVRL